MGKFMEAFPFKEVRPIQEDILNALERVYRDSDRFRYVLIEAGTGVGKSAIAKAIAAVEGDAYVLTATKQLQDQYVRDFAPEAATVKGKFLTLTFACVTPPRVWRSSRLFIDETASI